MRFKDGCEKYLTPNQLTNMTVDSIPVTEEVGVPMISAIPDETVNLGKGYYHGVYVLPTFNN